MKKMKVIDYSLDELSFKEAKDINGGIALSTALAGIALITALLGLGTTSMGFIQILLDG